MKQPSATLIAEWVDLDEHAVCDIFRKVRYFIVREMRVANRCLVIGGDDVDCEMDEICFRSGEALVDGEKGKFWLRFFGAV